MTSVGELKPLSAFEWASVCQYIVYISNVAGLEEVSSNDIVSFPLSRMGVKKVLFRKRRVLAIMDENKRRLELFVGDHKGELEDGEISVIRTIYVQAKRGIETVEEHIRVAEAYQAAGIKELFESEAEDDDDLPF